MSFTPDPEKLQTCPYNKAHQVAQSRMHVHLLKCRKQYPNGNKVKCPFDATHIINEAELDYHVTVCDKRVMLDSQVYVTNDEFRPQVELIGSAADVPCEENWEAEAAQCTINIQPKTHVYTKVKCVPPSERRKARCEGMKNYRPPPPPQ